MRICPACGNKRQSENITVTMHLCDNDYADIVERHGGMTIPARDEISAIYAKFGLEHAGPLPNKIKESESKARKHK